MKKTIIPYICSFNEFFSKPIPFDFKNQSYKPVLFKNVSRIGNYLQLYNQFKNNSFESIEVIPSQWLIDIISDEMLAIENDIIFFEVIVYKDGTAMLIAKYNLILGSRWIAMLDANTIPQQVK